MSALAQTQTRWRDYADATRGDHFAWWAEEHCVQSIDRFAGKPLILEDWQRLIMDEALAELAEDEAYWQTVVVVLPKKNGKTSLLASYALYALLENGGAPEILLAAATDKQAGRLFDSAVRFVKSAAYLSNRLVIREHEGQIAQIGDFGTLYRLSGDSGAAAGYNPLLVVVDELAEWNTPRRRRTWADISTAGELTRDAARVFVISHAGEPQERVNGILGQLIDRNEAEGEVERVHSALTISRDHRSRTIVFNYDAATHSPQDIDAIRAANPASWISTDRLVSLSNSPKLTPGRFLQLHGCVWTSSAGGFLDLEEWRALARPAARLERNDEIMLGFRGGATWALIACRCSDRALFTLGAQNPEEVGAPERDAVQAAMDSATTAYRVAGVFAAATPEWKTTVDGWRAELGRQRVIDVPVERPSPRTAQITERFQADARAGAIHHDGNRDLAAAIAGARIAIVRGHTYLVPDERGTPIAAALAALLAWEARAVLGVKPAPRSRVPMSWT